jgi:4-hydroxybenzoate polyprenyltransferase
MPQINIENRVPEEPHHHHHHHSPWFQKFLLRLAYSNAYLALPILALTMETYVYQKTLIFDWSYIGFVTFSTLFLYPFHRLFGLFVTPDFEYTKAQKEVSRHPNITRYSVVLGALGTLFFATQISMEQLSSIIPLALLSVGYSLPILPTTNGWKRIRDIPGIKIFIVTGVVTLLSSTLPLMSNSTAEVDIWLFGLERWLFLLAITIPFDVRDVLLDKKWNLQTIPLLLGTKNAMRLAIGLIYASMAVHIAHFFLTDILTTEIVFATLVAGGFTHFILMDFENRNSYLYNAWMIEGSMMYHFAFVTLSVVLPDLY